MTDPSLGPPDPAYRPCVGIMLVNAEGMIFVARRIDTPETAWQMPQGGIDPGESPSEAALRELHEEVGTDKATVIAESAVWRSYDLPRALQRRLWGGRFRGQAQRWFLLRFTGTDADIDLERHEPEFDAWRWAAPDELTALIVSFKREIYQQVLDEFRPWLCG